MPGPRTPKPVQVLENFCPLIHHDWIVRNLWTQINPEISLRIYDGCIKLRLLQSMRDQSICHWSYHAWKTMDYSTQVDISAMRSQLLICSVNLHINFPAVVEFVAPLNSQVKTQQKTSQGVGGSNSFSLSFPIAREALSRALACAASLKQRSTMSIAKPPANSQQSWCNRS